MARSKSKLVFVCESCGSESPKWGGRCFSCGDWNTLVEFNKTEASKTFDTWHGTESVAAQELSDIEVDKVGRLKFESSEINRVFGGGVVPGSVVLVAGEPGIGKSTLILRMAADIAGSIGPTLYVTGEESVTQIKNRSNRLGIDGKQLILLQTTVLGEIMHQLDKIMPVLVIIDSIQTIYDDSLSSNPGSIMQVRECARKMMQWAKFHAVPIVLSGHVTKGGEIAGPRVLEHMVDVVLHMEGDPIRSWRLIRVVKNRFGSTNDVGVYEMTERGLIDVVDPSETFLSERQKCAVGSVVVPTLEGTRPVMVEVQALTSPSILPSPRRVAIGVDYNRLMVVSAVLTRRVGMSLANQDIVVNATGGFRISEPAVDVGVALAIISSLNNIALPSDLAVTGEVGLSAEIRSVPQLQLRIEEVFRLGFKKFMIPSGKNIEIPDSPILMPVSTLQQASKLVI